MERKQLSDKLKLRFLKEIRAEKSGNPKSYIDYESCEIDIINSLSSMKIREELLEDISDPKRRAFIISGFDENTIKKYIDSIEDVHMLAIILESPNISNEFREQYVSKIPKDFDSFIKIRIFRNFDDSTIEKHLEDLPDDEKKYMIQYLKSDELKEKYLKGIEDEVGKNVIIASFESDELKQKYLEDIKGEYARANIIASLKSDDKVKESYLSDIKDESNRAKIIASFKQDKLKLSYLHSVEEVGYKAEIIISLENDEDKSRLCAELGDIYYETKIMATVKDEEIKKKFLYGKLHPGNFLARELDKYCCSLIKSFKNYTVKKSFINLMNLSHASEVMASITGDEKDFPAETIERLLLAESDKREESDLEDLPKKELEEIISRNQEKIKNNKQEIERRELMERIREQRKEIAEQEAKIKQLNRSNGVKTGVGGGDE